MNLTRRGRVLVGVVLVATLSGYLYGPRGLNAVAVPGVIVLCLAVYQLNSLERPDVERELPTHGERGETVRVRLSIDAGTSLPALVYEAVGEGLAATGNVWHVTLRDDVLSYDLQLRRRGERTVGPLTIEFRDVFGLVSRTFRYETGQSFFGSRRSGRGGLLVRPRVYPLAGPAQAAILGLYGSIGDDRQEFDYLRSYRRGDPLQDIHWKSSAKYPDEDFVVKEFTADDDAESLTVGVEATERTVDATADAAASVAADLLTADVDFVLATPVDRIDGEADDARERIMDHLARMPHGALDPQTSEEADVVIQGERQTVWIEIDGRRHRFRELVGGIEEPLPDSTPTESPGTPVGETAP